MKDDLNPHEALYMALVEQCRLRGSKWDKQINWAVEELLQALDDTLTDHPFKHIIGDIL